jgi:hypothetical protein
MERPFEPIPLRPREHAERDVPSSELNTQSVAESDPRESGAEYRDASKCSVQAAQGSAERLSGLERARELRQQNPIDATTSAEGNVVSLWSHRRQRLAAAAIAIAGERLPDLKAPDISMPNDDDHLMFTGTALRFKIDLPPLTDEQQKALVHEINIGLRNRGGCVRWGVKGEQLMVGVFLENLSDENRKEAIRYFRQLMTFLDLPYDAVPEMMWVGTPMGKLAARQIRPV